MNHLKNEKSPYLLQHVKNPVDWYPWGKEVFEKAKKENKPVFLSIGYSTCHWCHVMAHESFEDEEVAALLNREFFCIKVDREERPDIDSVYMSVCQALTGSGGWPLTVILTPEQKPFFAGTYFPKHQRYGQPGLVEILERVIALWKNNKKTLLEMGQQITELLAKETNVLQNPDKTLLKNAVNLLKQQFDNQWGGFGMPPKFPTPHNLLFLMQYSRLEKDKRVLKMVQVTLDAMALGGIHDHIGGGFSRYSTDAKWLVPHFEKMLYDNALLATAYLEGYLVLQDGFYKEVAKRTLDYVLRELTGDQGAFFCGQDADSEGVEGKYYLFMPDEVRKVLGEKANIFCKLYDITAAGNFEGKSIPNRIGQEKNFHKEMDDEREKLYQYRLQRTYLHKDDKVVLSWNAWTVAALAKAGRIMPEEPYLEAAVRAEQFIQQHMTDERGRLYHCWRDGKTTSDGQLDDYAVYVLAQLELYCSTQNPQYLQQAVFFAGEMVEMFEDRKQGGYFMTASDAENLITRPKETYDGAIPSGNSAAAFVLNRLAKYTAQTVWQKASERQNRFLAGSVRDYPAGHSLAMLSLSEVLYASKELVCVSAETKLPKELREFIMKNPMSNFSFIFKNQENAEKLEKILPYTKNYPIPDTGTLYYLCHNGMCSAPEQEFEKLGL